VLILSAASTCGQLCILYTIREFGVRPSAPCLSSLLFIPMVT
jgi:hypothetical protein